MWAHFGKRFFALQEECAVHPPWTFPLLLSILLDQQTGVSPYEEKLLHPLTAKEEAEIEFPLIRHPFLQTLLDYHHP